LRQKILEKKTLEIGKKLKLFLKENFLKNLTVIVLNGWVGYPSI